MENIFDHLEKSLFGVFPLHLIDHGVKPLDVSLSKTSALCAWDDMVKCGIQAENERNPTIGTTAFLGFKESGQKFPFRNSLKMIVGYLAKETSSAINGMLQMWAFATRHAKLGGKTSGAMVTNLISTTLQTRFTQFAILCMGILGAKRTQTVGKAFGNFLGVLVTSFFNTGCATRFTIQRRLAAIAAFISWLCFASISHTSDMTRTRSESGFDWPITKNANAFFTFLLAKIIDVLASFRKIFVSHTSIVVEG